LQPCPSFQAFSGTPKIYADNMRYVFASLSGAGESCLVLVYRFGIIPAYAQLIGGD
jgi:hypothetical protein